MIEGLALLGAWASLLGGLAAKVAHIKPAILPSLFVSLSVAFFYYSLVVRHWVAELSWSIIGTPEVTRFDVSLLLVPAGLACCWRGADWRYKVLGAVLIAVGFANVLPGLAYPLEYLQFDE